MAKSLAAYTIALGAALVPITASAQTLTTLYSFTGGKDGADPQAALTYYGGAFYGTTYSGAAANGGPCQFPGCGTVFKFTLKTNKLATLHVFAGGAADGASPLAAVFYRGGNLFGTTESGGSDYPLDASGTVFKIGLSGKVETILHRFTANVDGAYPQDPLIYENGLLYGTTWNQPGTVFSMDPDTGALTTLSSFSGNPGADISSGLLYLGGNLYGTTTLGGTNNQGTVFKVNARTGKQRILHNFGSGYDGARPTAGLVEVAGILYGTTLYNACGQMGFVCSEGTVYKIDPESGSESVLHTFTGGENADGEQPHGALIYAGGALWGTTAAGGAFGGGTIFNIDPASGIETVAYSFTGGSDGASPSAALTYVNGNFYGTTPSGGVAHDACEGPCGTLFEFSP